MPIDNIVYTIDNVYSIIIIEMSEKIVGQNNVNPFDFLAKRFVKQPNIIDISKNIYFLISFEKLIYNYTPFLIK